MAGAVAYVCCLTATLGFTGCAVIDAISGDDENEGQDGGSGFACQMFSGYCYEQPLIFPAGSDPAAVTLGDIDDDGQLDILVAARGSNEVVIIQPQLDPPLVGSVVSVQAPEGPEQIVVGNFAGDPQLDFAVASEAGSNVEVWMHDGFAFAQQSRIVLDGPFSMAVGDLDQDLVDDLAVLNRGTGDVSVLLGDGGGAFTERLPRLMPRGQPSDVVVGDFNDDGVDDIAAAISNPNGIDVFLGSGGGSFGPPIAAVATDAQDTPYLLAVADFDGDQMDDVAYAIQSGGGPYFVAATTGRGDGTFDPFGASFAVGFSSVDMIALDVEGGGPPDVVIASSQGGGGTPDLVIFENAGAFVNQGGVVAGGAPIAIAGGHLNDDAQADFVAVTTTGVGVILSNP